MKTNRNLLSLPCTLLTTVAGLTPPLRAVDQMPLTPVSGYTFDEGSGSTVADRFGGITGSLQGSAGFSSEAPLSYAGNFSLNLSATAADDYVDLGDPASLFFPGSFSISAWIRSSSVQTNQFGTYIVSDYVASADLSSMSIRLNGLNANQGTTPGQPSFFWETTGNQFPSARGITDIDASLNTWFHITAVWNAGPGETGVRSIFVNGVLEGTNDTPQPRVDYGGSLAIGRAGSFVNSAFNFNGQIDDVAFFNYALNGDEVSWLHHNSIRSIPVPPAPSFDVIAFHYNAASNEASLTWTSVPGAFYTVERSQDLQPGGWTALPGPVSSGGATTSFTDTTIPAGVRRVFYQVRRAP